MISAKRLSRQQLGIVARKGFACCHLNERNTFVKTRDLTWQDAR